MPRGAMRILNAGKVQADFRAQGRKTSEDTGEARPKPKPKAEEKKKRARDEPSTSAQAEKKLKTKEGLPKIAPNESLGEYNRRIEALLRPGVSGAIKKAAAAQGAQKKQAEDEKKARIAKAQGKVVEEESKEEEEEEFKPNKPVKAFAELPTRRRLNDIALAPPSLPKMRMVEKTAKKGGMKGGGRDPLNAGQKRIMEEERERVVLMYRELKARKEAERAK